MPKTSAAHDSVPPVPLVSVLPASGESLARLCGVPALALEWLPGISVAVYYIMNTYGVYPDSALLEKVAIKDQLRLQLENAGAD